MRTINGSEEIEGKFDIQTYIFIQNKVAFFVWNDILKWTGWNEQTGKLLEKVCQSVYMTKALFHTGVLSVNLNFQNYFFFNAQNVIMNMACIVYTWDVDRKL